MATTLRFRALLSDAAADVLALRARGELAVSAPQVSARVSTILTAIERGGEAALQKIAKEIDGAEVTRVSPATIAAARKSLEPSIERALVRAANNLKTVSEAERPRAFAIEVEPGILVERKSEPLARVGVYAPGGQAAYASSVLMGVIPAVVAGVTEVIVCSPPFASGLPSPFVLAAADIAGATAVYSVGGAQAIAAMAFGTATIERVQRIVGPGNVWVAEAKRQVSGRVGIDSPAGPSEILVIASADADPQRIAAELLAQAEHDEAASVVALVDNERLAREVERELLGALSATPRQAIARAALGARGALLVADDLAAAVTFANTFAAEHVLLMGERAATAVPALRCAGTVFVGEGASVAFGDYLTGCNHVLPTAGAARHASGLSVLDFLRAHSIQTISANGARRLGDDTFALATKEGLPAHAQAAKLAAALAATATKVAVPERPALRDLQRMTRPSRAAIDLSDNTNRFGLPPSAAPGELGDASRYPTPYGDSLKQTIASVLDLSSECVVTGCGSDDVINSVLRAFATPGDVIAFSKPTFSMVEQFAALQGLHVVDLADDATSRATVVYVCAPNNPTGADVPWSFIEDLLARTRGIVLVDEAYVEYSGRESYARRAISSQRVIVSRTFSKAFALAGLRVGYGIAAAALIEQIEKARGPYKVSVASEAVAAKVFARDQAWMQACVQDTITQREAFCGALEKMGLKPLPSRANFVLLPVTSNARALAAKLAAEGVAVRSFSQLPTIGDALRITMAPRADLDVFLGAFLRAWRTA